MSFSTIGCANVENKVSTAKLVIAFQLAWVSTQREAVRWRRRYSMTFQFGLVPAEKLFAYASGDPHGVLDVSLVKKQEIKAKEVFNLDCTDCPSL